ncbi:hypothetical protein [Vibrio mediterranei]|uniref:hypothetical protein n=1 Tax=Vibrio mediterranei TaxID=689 RepID=UPI00148D2C0D|nr:hypothetical protein [Vibrio mediterranei]NOH30567.1 hypothetical protein [Vibrio mediterranei]
MKESIAISTAFIALLLVGCSNSTKTQAPIATENESGRFCVANGGTYMAYSNQCVLEDGRKMDATEYFQDHQDAY